MQFAVAAGAGGLIGVEREHRADQSSVMAGIRTFPLVSIVGLIVSLLAVNTQTPAVLAGGVVGAFGMAIMFSHLRARAGFLGITTPVALVVTFLIGMMIGYGFTFEAVVIAIATTFLLVTKERLHRFAQYLDNAEILSALQFFTLVFILLPLTADLPVGTAGLDWFGRGGVVDPFIILLVVVFVSSISFVSLLAMRQVGPHRGMAVSGLLGGLVNSEATTASLAQRAKEAPDLAAPAALASVLASTTMIVRNLAIAAFADPRLDLLVRLVPFLVPVGLVGLVLAWRMRAGWTGVGGGIRVRNPFAVGPALRFAAIFAAVSIAANFGAAYLGRWGVYLTSLGGFVSAGAVIASMGSLAFTNALDVEVAARTSVLATGASILGKLFILRGVHQGVFRLARAAFLTLTLAALLATAASFSL